MATYTIAQLILAFSLVLLHFKMAESSENQDNILRDWAKVRYKKSLVEAFNRYEKQEEVRKSRLFF